ncbi:MAG: hypothetical protein WCP82_07280 [Alphaproteobacteria bacterium]
MRKPILFAIAGLLLASAGAVAQQTVLSAGSWVTGNVPKYSAVSSGQPVVIDSGLPPGSPNVTVVASLPTCDSTTTGQVYVVTDASSPTYGAALTGSSTTVALALCNGSSWRAH